MEKNSNASELHIIDSPADFPVNWEDSADAHIPWEQEAPHFPQSLTPMDYDFSAYKITEGLNKGAAHYRLPMVQRVCNLNTYAYIANVPMPPPPEGVDEEKLKATIGNLSEIWNNEWLPELKEHIAYWQAFDLSGADMTALQAHLEETERRVARMWEIHFHLAFPMLLAVTFFEEMYQDIMEDVSQLDVYALLTEVENNTVESSIELWKLSRQALANSVVCSVMETTAPSQVMEALSETPEGKTFLNSLNEYLQNYGERIDKLYVSFPAWNENPTPLISNLKAYMAQPDRDLLAEMDETVAERERSVAKAREKVANYPKPVVEKFEFLLKAAQQGYFLKEEHTSWIDFQATYHARQAVLECGRRLQDAAVIESKDDVFYLTLSELKETIATPSPEHRQTLVRERRAKETHFSQLTPPPRLGIIPQGAPPNNPVIRAIGKVFGAPPPQSENPAELLGLAGSRGVVRGTAKVLHSLDEASKLEQGDILVAATTTPPWTPIFANIAAVVTDSGGILSHPAVIAREYGIPAVVGTAQSTSVIKDGQMIEVDGDKGIVRILS